MANPEHITRIRQVLKQKNIDAAVITKLVNVRYLTDFSGTSGALVISPRKAFFLTDFRYQKQAKKQVSGHDIKIYSGSFDSYLCSLIERLRSSTVGFEANSLPYARFKKWASSLKAELIPLDNLVENLRLKKEKKELGKIRKAADISDRAFRHILSFIKPGVQEREIAIELEYFMRKQGADRYAFELIVAGGRRSALPHATNSANKVRENAFLVLDFGAVYKGYCSDLSRTVFVGKPGEKERKLYKAVLSAQEKAVEKVAVGQKARAIDSTAREFLMEQNLGDYFGHNLGHGVGLEIHEAPVLGPKSNDVLQSGMVFTIEPGVYLPEKGGVRIEDLVALGEEGAEVLTKSSKELLTI